MPHDYIVVPFTLEITCFNSRMVVLLASGPIGLGNNSYSPCFSFPTQRVMFSLTHNGDVIIKENLTTLFMQLSHRNDAHIELYYISNSSDDEAASIKFEINISIEFDLNLLLVRQAYVSLFVSEINGVE